jgi:hypothetical protein
MTIRFACDCGQQLVAADQHAGKRVRCTVCGSSQTVPGGEAAADGNEAAAMARFPCVGCGQTCQARPEHAGKTTRCPRCGILLTIPGSAGGFGETDAFQAERPLAGAAASRPDLTRVVTQPQGEGTAPFRPRSIKKSRRRVWLGLTAGALLLLGAALFLLLRRGAVAADFDLVPRDAQGFVTVRVADLVHTPLGKKALARLNERDRAQINLFERAAGLALEDIERVTVVLVDGDNEIFWVILKTLKPYDQNKLLRLVDSRSVEGTHAGKRYHRTESVAFYFASATVVVVGPEEGVRRCLEQPAKPRSGPLNEALRAASDVGHQFAAGSNVPADLQGRIRKQSGGMFGVDQLLGQMAPLFDVRTAYATATVGEDIDWQMTLDFPDKERAKKGEVLAGKLLGVSKLPLPVLRFALTPLLSRVGITERRELDQVFLFVPMVQKQLGQIKPRQSGSSVILDGKLNGSDLLRTFDELNKHAQQGH